MNSQVEFIYSSLFNSLDNNNTLTARCTLMDLLNGNKEPKQLSLHQCREAMFNFYEKYNDKYPDITYCLMLTIEEDTKTTYKQLRFQGLINDDDILKEVREKQELKDLFIFAIENKEYSNVFVKYDKVFSYHNIPMKQIETEKVENTATTNIQRSSTVPVAIKKETSESVDVAERSQTEPKLENNKVNSSSSNSVSRSISNTPTEKKQWTAPKAKLRGIDSMFKRKTKTETPVKQEASSSIAVKNEVEKAKADKIENKFQFTSRKLIDKRKKEEKLKEQERVKIVQDRLNSLKNNDKPIIKKEEKQEEEEEEEPPLKKQKIEQHKEKQMDDIFHSDSDYEMENDDKDFLDQEENHMVTSENNNKRAENNTSVSMTTDSTSFIELVVGKQEPSTERKQVKNNNNKSKPVMVLESDSQDSSDSDDD
ncbi:hypothetical protein HANVADRAFT_65292 [Hanseniaspora valbyensis NRRL Y-1626]|uniref:Uncharacterized protein n=1 Tax=Hanseniaspora valbyensis NRRL Y-1626 TaxID=766949 RepID=A0A1B7TJV0_9ASCO|nr:hypothetical protein HANVADRAFT_65292 [Hanseniaspora valbyensis NRRL Y-1626]